MLSFFRPLLLSALAAAIGALNFGVPAASATNPNDIKPTACASLYLTSTVTGAGVINGTAANELIVGSSGVDTIRGYGGNDCVLGGGGNDNIRGDVGLDVCLGGPGTDTISSTCETALQSDSPPVSTLYCDGSSSCSSGTSTAWHESSTSVSASAVFTAGVDRILYTLDGSVPTLTNGLTYAAPIALTRSAAVTYRAYDLNGNAETPRTLLVRVNRFSENEWARRFRPRILFDTDELWRPLRITPFLNEIFNEDPGFVHHMWCDNDQYPPGGCGELYDASELYNHQRLDVHGYLEQGADLAAPNDVRSACNAMSLRDCNVGDRSAIYYNHTRDNTSAYQYIDYWWFFRYNDYGPLSFINAGDHEGDWEGGAVVVDTSGSSASEGEPAVAYLWLDSHGDPTWSSYLGDIFFTGAGYSHPTVFVANGTHATYSWSCDSNETCGNVPAAPTPEGHHDGQSEWGWNSVNGDPCSEVETCTIRMDDLPSTHWSGRWGISPDGVFGDPSPTSPGTKSRYICVASGFASTECSSQPPTAADESQSKSSLFPTSDNTSLSVDSNPASSCENWFGPDVVALLCDTEGLSHSLNTHTLDERGSARFIIATRFHRTADAPGLAQLVGPVLKQFDRIVLRGSLSNSAALVVRYKGENGSTRAARFERLGLTKGGQAILEIQSGVSPRAVVHSPDGVVQATEDVVLVP